MKGSFALPNGKRVAVSLVVNVEEGSELNVADGDKSPEPVDELGVALRAPVRNLANESNYQYGIKAGAPRVLRLLTDLGVTCTFTATAVALERAGALASEIAVLGHEVCSHGYRWAHQFSYDEDREREFIRRATESLAKTTGQRPLGWLSRYLFTENTRRLLAEEGYVYHMDDYSDDVPRREMVETVSGPVEIAVVPYALDTNDMKMWTAPAYTPQQWLDYAIASFDELYIEGANTPKIMSVGVHLRIIGRPGRIGALRSFIQHVGTHREARFATRLELAQWCLATV